MRISPLLSGTSGLPNDVSCSSRSGSQVDLPGVTGVRGIFSSVGSSVLDSCSPKGSISMSAIFYSAFLK